MSSYKPLQYFKYKIFLFVSITLNRCRAWFNLYGLHRAVNNGKQAKDLKWKYMFPVGIQWPLTLQRDTSNHSLCGLTFPHFTTAMQLKPHTFKILLIIIESGTDSQPKGRDHKNQYTKILVDKNSISKISSEIRQSRFSKRARIQGLNDFRPTIRVDEKQGPAFSEEIWEIETLKGWQFYINNLNFLDFTAESYSTSYFFLISVTLEFFVCRWVRVI